MENNGLKYGVILGLVHVVITMVVYFIDPNLLFSSLFTFLELFGLFILGAILAISNEKTKLGGFIGFSEAFKVGLIAVFVISAIANLFGYVLFNFIDPNLITMAKDYQIEMLTSGWMSDFLDEEQLEKIIDKLDEEEFMTLSATFFNIAFLGLVGAFFTAIISLILKRENPAGNALDN